MLSKPYQLIPIQDCQEPLVSIPWNSFAWVEPHPYWSLGAPYGDRSPFFVRKGILKRLEKAQQTLQLLQPDWRLQIFDAYRPIPVQQFMVEYTFEQERQAQGLGLVLTAEQEKQLWEQVHQFWAVPSDDPKTPPPHSTGAAVDLTLVNAQGQPVDMGSPIDEISQRSYPDYFAIANPTIHKHRELLKQSMIAAGFLQHPREWWHFSYGDQLWVWLCQEKGQDCTAAPLVACYGAAE